MIIPHDSLSRDALRALVEEFVTRDGTDHSDTEPRICAVLAQLERKEVVITFDPDSRTTGIISADVAD